jgi:hypothetical protein
MLIACASEPDVHDQDDDGDPVVADTRENAAPSTFDSRRL